MVLLLSCSPGDQRQKAGALEVVREDKDFPGAEMRFSAIGV